MYRTIFGLVVSLKLFLGRFDMRTMQVGFAWAPLTQQTCMILHVHLCQNDLPSWNFSIMFKMFYPLEFYWLIH